MLAEKVRQTSIRVAKYLKKARMKYADFEKGFTETYEKGSNAIANAIFAAIKAFVNAVNNFIEWLKKQVDRAKEAGKTALGMIAKGAIIAAIVAIIATVGPVALAVYGIVKVLGVAYDTIQKLFEEVKKALIAVKDAVAKGLDAITTALGVLAGAIAALPGGIFKAINMVYDEYFDDKEKELE